MPHYESTQLFSIGENYDESKFPKEVSYQVQLDTLDDFTFKYSGLVCSLEHGELKKCFETNSKQDGIIYDKDCLKASKDYGDCIYKRHFLASALSSNTRHCHFYYSLYEKCSRLMNFRQDFHPATVMVNHENCKALTYGDYLNCLKFSLRIHNGPFDSKV